MEFPEVLPESQGCDISINKMLVPVSCMGHVSLIDSSTCDRTQGWALREQLFDTQGWALREQLFDTQGWALREQLFDTQGWALREQLFGTQGWALQEQLFGTQGWVLPVQPQCPVIGPWHLCVLQVYSDIPPAFEENDIPVLYSPWWGGYTPHDKAFDRMMLIRSMYIYIDVHSVCVNLRLSFQRFFMYRHDYIAALQRSCHVWTQVSLLSYFYYDVLMSMHNMVFSGHRSKQEIGGVYRLYRRTYRDTASVHIFCPLQPHLTYPGGGTHALFACNELQQYMLPNHKQFDMANSSLSFVERMSGDKALEAQKLDPSLVICRLPLSAIVHKLPLAIVRSLCREHGIHVAARTAKPVLLAACAAHSCSLCHDQLTLFNVVPIANKKAKWNQSAKGKEIQKHHKKHHDAKRRRSPSYKNKRRLENKVAYQKSKRADRDLSNHSFPPLPASDSLVKDIVTGFCEDTHPDVFSESGCAVCGKLTQNCYLSDLSEFKHDKSLLEVVYPMTAVRERKKSSDPLVQLEGPVLVPGLNKICQTCKKALGKNRTPDLALANGLWLGEVPPELQNLRFAEKMLIARYRHNKCIVIVKSGMHKMCSNAITYTNPMPKIYNKLPPPVEELDEVLAFIFTGPNNPTPEDFERCPLLVRRKKVTTALEWLKLNHQGYYDLEIDYEVLKTYPENGIPVVVDYRRSATSKIPEAMSVHDNGDEDGTEKGECSFVVHNLSGEQLHAKGERPDTMRSLGMLHLRSEGRVLAIGHSEKPESLYDNPMLYPLMFPWLFPYGLGGIGNTFRDKKLPDIQHKRHLLMYYDKRFQTDQYFPFIAFNHEQIKNCTSGGFLLADKQSFDTITDRLLGLDLDVLEFLTQRLQSGEHVRPVTDSEKACYQLMLDLDHIGGKVQGSMTNKKYMRNQIWSMTAFKGAPTWYITLSPADVKHPICLYYADTNEKFSPELRGSDERFLLIAHNPVAGARFFHFMVEMFIKHVLGVGEDHPGIYGETSAYYGTVEQQGRLTLHLHLLLWIMSCLTPQEIRDRIMASDSVFQSKLVEYLESVHTGDFMTGQQSEVLYKKNVNSVQREYRDPTQVLPVPPPSPCNIKDCVGCSQCEATQEWWSHYKNTVDDLLVRSNVHTCSGGIKAHKDRLTENGKNSKGKKKHSMDTPGCKSNKWGTCKARFPRQIIPQTMVEPETGALLMKKNEEWINTVTPVLTYLVLCNTDVTSLLSGTAIKAVVAYVSDYITKSSLKTYMLFEAIKSVFEKNSEFIGGNASRREKARKLLTQVVNSLTSKLEIGGPMACLYLLGNPDHYTNGQFCPFYWKSYVRQVRQAWDQDNDTSPDKLVITKKKGQIVGFSQVLDYVHRPAILSSMTLYDWVRLYDKRKCKPSELEGRKAGNTSAEWIDDVDSEDDELNIIDINEDTDVKVSKHISSAAQDLFVDEKNPAMVSNESELKLVSVVEDEEEHVDERCDEEEHAGEDSVDDEEGLSDDADELNIGEDEKMVEKEEYWHPLMDGHPQAGTHMVKVRKSDKEKIPDFIGGALPRPDRGDREYYCCTMLTLFKPWRSGKELKLVDQSWGEAFDSFVFNERQMELMKFFTIRYDCLDARDDFSAQRKEGQRNSGGFTLHDDDMMDDLDCSHLERQMLENEFDVDEDALDVEGPPGRMNLVRKRNMQEMENIMTNAGWLDTSPDGLPDITKVPIRPEVNRDGSHWRRELLAKKKEVLDHKHQHAPEEPGEKEVRKNHSSYDKVEVVDASFLNKSFRAELIAEQNFIDETVTEFSLNTEQDRAFRIVANHVTLGGSKKLHMYLGGMGGTGKSQVIKALISLFEKRKESHRFLVLAPTGSAAALLSGSTYHSVLGIFESITDDPKAYEKIRERLRGVDYIFLDEVSMVSCRDMYKICAQLAKAFAIHEEPFGGINVIFAGDFAQLPPPMKAPSLYSGSVGTQVHAGLTVYGQEAAIGKALWHQVTTVVILRQNMRQNSQSPDDAKFRKALENMRYGACTPDDISFLRTRIAGRGLNQPKLSSKRFRFVSIITAWNAHKDKLNEIGSLRFAKETGQTLVDFYSSDSLSHGDIDKKIKRGRAPSARALKILSANKITSKLQEELWNLPPGATGHVAGKLSLCIGLPVMIRRNDATELCITKGQEGYVAGWQSKLGPKNQRMLDTLFVRLANPPATVKIDGLPENVVPLTAMSQTVPCFLADDTVIDINRSQVLLLPNFGMTDFAAQGKTRPDNPVDLNNCPHHQSVYTCLSRSSSAAGTIIVQGFDQKKISSGTTGFLRQELRELELLDEITKEHYEGNIPDSAGVNGHVRNILIDQFRRWKGVNYIPSKVHPAIAWSASDPFPLTPVVNAAKWMLVDKQSATDNKTKDISRFVPVKSVKRRRTEFDGDPVDTPKAKKLKPAVNSAPASPGPAGLIWDGTNFSCAYDSLFTILHSIWSVDHTRWGNMFHEANQYLSTLAKGFDMHLHERTTIENARDNVRQLLHESNPIMFPMGAAYINVADLARMTSVLSHPVANTKYECTQCNHSIQARSEISYFAELQRSVLNIQRSDSVAQILGRLLSMQTNKICPECDGPMLKNTYIDDAPKLLILHIPYTDVKINQKIKFGGETMFLRGVVYYGSNHYTSRIIDIDRNVWFHDGMTLGSGSQSQGSAAKVKSKYFNKCNRKNVALLVYAQT
jgi:hypothetical protein